MRGSPSPSMSPWPTRLRIDQSNFEIWSFRVSRTNRIKSYRSASARSSAKLMGSSGLGWMRRLTPTGKSKLRPAIAGGAIGGIGSSGPNQPGGSPPAIYRSPAATRATRPGDSGFADASVMRVSLRFEIGEVEVKEAASPRRHGEHGEEEHLGK